MDKVRETLRHSLTRGSLPLYVGETGEGAKWLDLVRLPHLLVLGDQWWMRQGYMEAAAAGILVGGGSYKLLFASEGKARFPFFEGVEGLLAPEIHGEGALAETLSLLSSLVEERLLLFKKAKVSDLANYRIRTGERLPRIVAFLDDFSAIPYRKANLERLENILFKGRQAGIHLVLGMGNPLYVRPQTMSLFGAILSYRLDSPKFERLFDLRPGRLYELDDREGVVISNSRYPWTVRTSFFYDEELYDFASGLSKADPSSYEEASLMLANGEGNPFSKAIDFLASGRLFKMEELEAAIGGTPSLNARVIEVCKSFDLYDPHETSRGYRSFVKGTTDARSLVLGRDRAVRHHYSD